MCKECHSHPCMRGCPNEADPIQIYECENCGQGIYEGEEAMIWKSEAICERCVSKLTITI